MVIGFVIAALLSLSLGRGVVRARLLVTEGVIGGLGVMRRSDAVAHNRASHLASDPDVHAHTLPTNPAEEAVRVAETAAV